MKKYYYIGISNDKGMSFVTKINQRDKACFWNPKQKPLALTLEDATELAENLCMNMQIAVVVLSFFFFFEHFICEKEPTK